MPLPYPPLALSRGILDSCAGARLTVVWFNMGMIPGLGDLRVLNKVFLPWRFADGFRGVREPHSERILADS